MLMKDTKGLKIESVFLYFILAQPIIDLVTSLSITYFQSSFTAGTLLRFFMMFVGVLYLLFGKNKEKRTIWIYLIVLGLYFILHLTNNLLVKNPIMIGEEIRFIAKATYFLIMLLTFVYVFAALKRNVSDWREQILSFIVFSMTIVSGIMVISGLTGTAFESYEFNKVGHKGWFFAANEIGAILSIGFPVVVLFGIKRATSWAKAYNWIPTLLMVYSLFALGTKVGYGAIIITILISLTITIIEYLKRKKIVVTRNLGAVTFQGLLLAGILLYTPYSAVAHNMNIHFDMLGLNPPTNQAKIENEDKATIKQSKEQVQNIVLSSRDEYLKLHQGFYNEAPFSQKLLGMGYAGNFEKYPKLIEMDFYDLFFSFGILGFVLYIIPLLFVLLRGLFQIGTDLRNQLNLENTLIGTGILLGLGIAATAGHVIAAPAVSIYLAILLAYMTVKLEIIK